MFAIVNPSQDGTWAQSVPTATIFLPPCFHVYAQALQGFVPILGILGKPVWDTHLTLTWFVGQTMKNYEKIPVCLLAVPESAVSLS